MKALMIILLTGVAQPHHVDYKDMTSCLAAVPDIQKQSIVESVGCVPQNDLSEAWKKFNGFFGIFHICLLIFQKFPVYFSVRFQYSSMFFHIFYDFPKKIILMFLTNFSVFFIFFYIIVPVFFIVFIYIL